MSIRNAAMVSASATVGLAAVFGGAFYPGPRIVVGALLAVILCGGITAARGPLACEEWTVFLFVAWGVISATAAAGAPLAAREVLTVWIVAAGLWVMARRSRGWSTRVSLLILIATAVILAIGVVFEVIGLRGLRAGGLLENPNVTAALLVVSLPIIFLVADGSRWRFAAAAMVIVGLILTGSRAGLLAMLAVVVMMLPGKGAKIACLLAGGAGVTAVLALRFVSNPDVLAWFRPAIWAAVLRLWASRPLLGVGPGGLLDAAGVERLLHADHVGQRQFLIAYAESSPLAVLVQTGLVGLLIAVLACFLWWRSANRAQRWPRFLGAIIAAMIVVGAFHDLLTVDIVLWWWALGYGLVEARAAGQEIADRGARLPVGVRPLVGLGCALVILWGIVQPAWARKMWRSEGPTLPVAVRTLRAEPWFDAPLEWRMRELLKRGEWRWETAGQAIAVSNEAVRVHPGAARLWSIRGMVHARVEAEFGPWPDAVDGARASFARAVELEPHQPWSYLEWARLERNLGNPREAVRLVQRALAEEPHTVQARLFLARLELDRGDLEAAYDAYAAAVESARLRGRAGLNAYERELLSAPPWQFREISEALR